MREIKFRLLLDGKIVGYEWYIIVNKVMCTMHRREGESTAYLIYADPYNLDKADVHTYNPIVHDAKEQFAGLKDKNGVEIYEGDIVKGKKGDFSCDTIGVVKFYGMSFVFEGTCDESEFANDDKKWFWATSSPYRTDVQVEIIGNIHQRPELLNQEK